MGGYTITQESFRERANKAHNNFYSYDKTLYVHPKTKVIITCPEHGDFEQGPIDHLGGHGCRKCFNSKNRKWTEEEDIFLKENYATLGVGACQTKLMNKSIHAIRGRAQVLGISKPQQDWPYKNLSPHRWSMIVSRAAKKGFEIDITPEYVEATFEKQGEKCAMTGRKLVMCQKSEDNTASVDRIDSDNGYTMGNIQIVHKDVNWMKNEFSDEYFYEVCRDVSKTRAKDFNYWDNGLIEDNWNDTEFPDYRLKSSHDFSEKTIFGEIGKPYDISHL